MLRGRLRFEMKSFEIFRSKDPQVSAWLQNNGYRNRHSNGFQEKEEKPVQSSKKEEENDVKSKEVKFSVGKYMHSKIPTLAFRQTIPELRSNMAAGVQSRGHLKNMAKSSKEAKRAVSLEKSEPAQMFSKNSEGVIVRSFSSPPINEFHNGHSVKSRPNLSRRYSMATFSSSSDRPSNIPVQIRNNNVRLRKYSCPENYISTRKLDRDQREDVELGIYGFGKKTTNASTTFSQQLATESTNQTSQGRKLREQTIDQQRQALKGKSVLKVEIPGVENEYAERRKDNIARKDFKDSLFVTATDINANEVVPESRGQMFSCSSESSDGNLAFSLNEEDSLQSYSLDVQPMSTRSNFPSSMYSRRGAMLTWLGEVNRNNPQFWS